MKRKLYPIILSTVLLIIPLTGCQTDTVNQDATKMAELEQDIHDLKEQNQDLQGQLDTCRKLNDLLKGENTSLKIVNKSEFEEVASVKEDIDGDGVVEEITLSVSENDSNRYTLSIKRYATYSITSYGSNIDRVIKIVDIDKNDNIKEIAIPESGPSSDEKVAFYTMDRHDIKFIGKIDGSFDYMAIGNKEVIGSTRGNILHTWFHKDTFKLLLNHTLILDKPENGLYSMGDWEVTVQKSIPIYKSPNGDQLVNLKVGEKVKLVATDDKENILLETEDGKQGWIMIEGYDGIKGTNYRGSEVFEGLSYAD